MFLVIFNCISKAKRFILERPRPRNPGSWNFVVIFSCVSKTEQFILENKREVTQTQTSGHLRKLLFLAPNEIEERRGAFGHEC